MDLKNDIDWKSLVIGSAVTAGISIMASRDGLDWLMLFSSIGLLYVGWTSKNIKYGIILGAIAATPMIYLTLVMETFGNDPFYTTTTGLITVVALFLILGAFIDWRTVFSLSLNKHISVLLYAIFSWYNGKFK